MIKQVQGIPVRKATTPSLLKVTREKDIPVIEFDPEGPMPSALNFMSCIDNLLSGKAKK